MYQNPAPIIPYLKELNKPIAFHITLTPYGKDIEPGINDKKKIIESIKEVSKIVGIDNNILIHNPKSSLQIGELEIDDIIKERRY